MRDKEFWPTLIVSGIKSWGGETEEVHMSPDLYGWVEDHGNLTERELEASPHGGRCRFEHTMRATASQMVRRQELKRLRPGVFRLLPPRQAP